MANEAVFVPVLPSFDGFFKDLSKGAKQGGDQAGRDMAAAMEKSLKQAEKKVESLSKAQERAHDRAADATDKTRIAQLKLSEALDDGSASASKIADLTAKYEKAQRDEAAAAKNSEKATKDLTKAQGELQKATDQSDDAIESHTDNLDGFSGSVKDAIGQIGGFVGALAGVAGVAAFAGMGKELVGETSLINMQLGHTGAAAQNTSDQIRIALTSGVATGAEEAANAIGAIESQWKYLGSEGEQTAGELADNFMAFARVMEVDVAEATQTAGQLVLNGLAPDIESAADLMTTAMQRVPMQMRDEIPEIINEYGVHFAGLGLSGEEAFSMLVSASERGKWALDKTGDSLKEFQLRGSDMSKASVEAYELVGLNAEEMSNKVATGGEGAREALQRTAEGLLGIESPSERANAAIALFGTPIEDLSVDQIPQFLESLTGMEDHMAGAEGSSQALADTIANSLDGRLNTLKGTVTSLAGDAFMWLWDIVENKIIPGFQDLGDWIQRNETWIGPLASAVGAAATAWGLWTLAVKGWQTATKIATGVQVAFNAVMAANPIMLAAMAIAALVAGLVYFFTQTELGQEIWGNFTAFLSETWENVSEVFGNVVENIKEWWSGLTSDLSEGWESLKSGVFDAWNSTVEGVKSGWESATGAISDAWQSVSDAFTGTWETIKTGVFDAWTSYVDQVKANWDIVTGALSTAWTWVKDTLGAGWDWIRDNVFSKFTETVGSVKDRFDGFVDALGEKWSSLRALLAKPVNFLISTVYNDGILRAFNVIAGILPGLDEGQPLAGIPEHATGGHIRGPGTGTSDDVLMWGSNGEHMWTAREVQQLGGHGAMYAMRDAVDSGRPFTFDGQGGVAILPKTDERAGDLAGAAPHLLIPGFAEGGAIRPMWEMQLENGHRAAKMRHGNPYTWGHEDCSGYMSMIADAIINGGDGIRKWATSSFPGGQPWVPGLGAGFSVGVHDNPGGPGGGHTAGTLTGVGNYMTTNVESGGSPSLVKYGVGAAGADSPQFHGVHPGQFHLAIGADGAFESGGSADPAAMRGWISDKLGGVVDTIMDPLVSLLPEKPPEWQGIPRGVYETGRDGLVETIATGVAGLTDGLATVWNAVRNIPDLISEALTGGDSINTAAGEGYHKGGLAPAGRGFMAKTAIEPEMVLNPAMTRAFINWMNVSPESLDVMGRELFEAFNGGDWGHGELAYNLGSQEVAKAIIDGAAAMGELSREISPILADGGKDYATSALDLVGLGGLVDITEGVVAKISDIAGDEEFREAIKTVQLDPDGYYSGREIARKLEELGLDVEEIRSKLGGSILGGITAMA